MHSSDKGIHGGDMMKMMMMTVCVGIEFSSRVLLGKENCNVMLVVVVIRCVFFSTNMRGKTTRTRSISTSSSSSLTSSTSMVNASTVWGVCGFDGWTIPKSGVARQISSTPSFS